MMNEDKNDFFLTFSLIVQGGSSTVSSVVSTTAGSGSASNDVTTTKSESVNFKSVLSDKRLLSFKSFRVQAY